MDPISILTILGQFAPTLIKWATGSEKASVIAGMAVETAKTITGGKNLDDSLEVLKKDPEKALEYQTAMLNQDSEFEKLYMEDKKDARARDIVLESRDRGNRRADWLVVFAVFTVTGILCVITFRPITDEFAKNTMLVILGMYLGELKNIYAFEFGTTRRSGDKTDTIDTLISKQK